MFLLTLLLCLACRVPNYKPSLDTERAATLQGNWFFCVKDGYNEWYCNEFMCFVAVSWPNSQNSNGFADVIFYYEIVSDTLYTTLVGASGKNYKFHICHASPEEIEIEAIGTNRLSQNKVDRLKKIKGIHFTPLNIDKNPYKRYLYEALRDARKKDCNCPRSVAKSIKELGDIDISFLDDGLDEELEPKANAPFERMLQQVFRSLPEDMSKNAFKSLAMVLKYVQSWHKGLVPEYQRLSLSPLTLSKLIDFSTLKGWRKASLINVWTNTYRTSGNGELRIKLQEENLLKLSGVQFDDDKYLAYVESLGHRKGIKVIELAYSASARDNYFKLKKYLQEYD